MNWGINVRSGKHQVTNKMIGYGYQHTYKYIWGYDTIWIPISSR